jgi:hypothetical protein
VKLPTVYGVGALIAVAMGLASFGVTRLPETARVTVVGP